MGAGLDGIARVLVMEVMRRGDDDRIRLPGQELAMVLCGEGEAEMLLHPLQFGRAVAAHAVQYDIVPLLQDRNMALGGEPAGRR